MIIFVSDMHFGRSDPATERAEESTLLACLDFYENQVERLYLLGDVFDQYIEYRHLVPKGLARLQGLLARWSDRGIPVTYLKGNHDPWHIDYFEDELGVHVCDGPLIEPLYDNDVYMHHGDLVRSRIPFYGALKKTLRHPVPVALYRNLLPGDSGMRLARWARNRLHTDEIDPRVAEQLRVFAEEVLNHQACNLVVMGHSHHPEYTNMESGAYMNTGSWRLDRTYGRLTPDGIQLLHWNGTEPVDMPASTSTTQTGTIEKRRTSAR